MRVATAAKSPSLPVLAFPLCMLDTMPAPSLPPVFVHMVYPSHWWPPSCITIFNTALKHLLHKLILSHSHHMPKPSQCAVLHPLNHTTIHSLCRFPHHTIIVFAYYYTSLKITVCYYPPNTVKRKQYLPASSSEEMVFIFLSINLSMPGIFPLKESSHDKALIRVWGPKLPSPSVPCLFVGLHYGGLGS